MFYRQRWCRFIEFIMQYHVYWKDFRMYTYKILSVDMSNQSLSQAVPMNWRSFCKVMYGANIVAFEYILVQILYIKRNEIFHTNRICKNSITDNITRILSK